MNKVKSAPSLKQLVARGVPAIFIEAYDGAILYEIDWASGTEPAARVKVPFEDTKGARFPRVMRSSELMKWVRQYLESIKSVAATHG